MDVVASLNSPSRSKEVSTNNNKRFRGSILAGEVVPPVGDEDPGPGDVRVQLDGIHNGVVYLNKRSFASKSEFYRSKG